MFCGLYLAAQSRMDCANIISFDRIVRVFYVRNFHNCKLSATLSTKILSLAQIRSIDLLIIILLVRAVEFSTEGICLQLFVHFLQAPVKSKLL